MVVMGVLLLTPCSPSIDLCMEVLKAESGDGSENPPKTEDGRRKESEVGRRKESEVGRRKESEVGRRKTEVGSDESADQHAPHGSDTASPGVGRINGPSRVGR